MAFQQMSQEVNHNLYVPLAMYLGLSFYIWHYFICLRCRCPLANDYFLEHSSRDVRLLVACSIADIFRVFAPNAPYDRADIIKRIFLFFIQQLKGLQDPKDATFKRYFYLLEVCFLHFGIFQNILLILLEFGLGQIIQHLYRVGRISTHFL